MQTLILNCSDFSKYDKGTKVFMLPKGEHIVAALSLTAPCLANNFKTTAGI